jgi:hypothetical protein
MANPAAEMSPNSRAANNRSDGQLRPHLQASFLAARQPAFYGPGLILSSNLR